MGRGPSLKTELKKQKKKIETEFNTKLKLYKKHPEVWIGDRVKDIAKQTGMTDIAKLGAVVGMTFVMKSIIDTTEDIRESTDMIIRYGPVGGPIFGVLRGIFPDMFPSLGMTPEQKEGFFPDWMDWIIAFTLAYIVVEHFGAIMQGAGDILSSMTGLARSMLVGGAKGI